jgi:lysophospholipase L1-like esterase
MEAAMRNSRFRRRWGWLIPGLGSLAALLVASLKKLVPWPTRVVVAHKQPGEQLVVLFGDSITQGTMSHNYVDILVQRLGPRGYRFFNAGIGGDTAYNLLKRLSPVVESQPDAVVIFVGTNDVITHLRGGYMSAVNQRLKRLPQAMTLEWYISIVREIVQRISHDTAAQIALCSIPILGEDPDSDANDVVRRFNAALEALTDELNIAYLPVHEGMEQVLRARNRGTGQAYDEERFLQMMLAAAWAHNVRRRSWDAVSVRNGLALTTDLVHLNGHGATLVADLIERWLLGCPAASAA